MVKSIIKKDQINKYMNGTWRRRPLFLVLWKLRQGNRSLKHTERPYLKNRNRTYQNRWNRMYLLSQEFMNGHSYRKDSLGLGVPLPQWLMHKAVGTCLSTHMRTFLAIQMSSGQGNWLSRLLEAREANWEETQVSFWLSLEVSCCTPVLLHRTPPSLQRVVEFLWSLCGNLKDL